MSDSAVSEIFSDNPLKIYNIVVFVICLIAVPILSFTVPISTIVDNGIECENQKYKDSARTSFMLSGSYAIIIAILTFLIFIGHTDWFFGEYAKRFHKFLGIFAIGVFLGMLGLGIGAFVISNKCVDNSPVKKN